MPNASITKRFTLESAHQLPAQECYGKCQRLHGHSYKLYVKISGPVNDKAWVMNFSDLGQFVDQHIVDKCDHYFLNEVYPGMITTAENLAIEWGRLVVEWLKLTHPEIHLDELVVWETEKCCVTVTEKQVLEALEK